MGSRRLPFQFIQTVFALIFYFLLAGVPAHAAPSAPSHLAATATSTTRIALTWSAPAGGGLPTAYFIYRGSSITILPQLGITTITSYADKSVSPGATYYYAVAA